MKRHSLLFGVQDYPDAGALKPLKYAHADVDALAELASDPRYMGEVGQVVVVKDPTNNEARQAFRDFFTGVGRDDVAIIHFSGHGLRDDVGDLFLCFTDADENDLEFTAVKVSRLGEWLEKKRMRRALITLDCCYSGAAGAQMTRDSLTSSLRSAERPLPDGTGLYILSSADATQRAQEGAAGLGVFTAHLLEGIRSGAADTNDDGEISVSEIAEYLQREVPREAAQQMPQLTAHKVSGTFVVARNPAKLEADAARAAAEAAAARAAERARIVDAANAKFKEHVAFGSVPMTFAGAVQAWVTANHEAPPDDPRYALLRDFGAGRLTAVEFYQHWSAENQPEASAKPAEAAGKAPPKSAPALGPALAATVQRWLARHHDAPRDHPRVALLQRFAVGEVDAATFAEEWAASESVDRPKTQPPQKPPRAEPPPRDAASPPPDTSRADDRAQSQRKPAQAASPAAAAPGPASARPAAPAPAAEWVTFWQAVRTCLAKYATFSGRATRAEYWWFVLFSALASLVAMVSGVALDGFLLELFGYPYVLWELWINDISPTFLAVQIALALPGLAVLVRRLHDVGRSGWWLLVALVPVLGVILLLYWLVQPSAPRNV